MDNYFAQLYIDTGAGFNEKESIKKDINTGEYFLVFDLHKYKNIYALRFDPSNSIVALYIHQVEILPLGSDNFEIPSFEDNALERHSDLMIFDTDYPNITFNFDIYNKPFKLVINVNYVVFGVNVYPYIIQNQREILKLNEQRRIELIQNFERELAEVKAVLQDQGNTDNPFLYDELNIRFVKIYEYLKIEEVIKGKSDLAKQLNTYNHVINSILKGKRNLTASQIFLLITKLGVNADYIFKGEGSILPIENQEDFDDISEKVKSEQKFEIPIPSQIKTAIKQYLIYFNDYARITIGMEVNLEVRNSEKGLEIEIPSTQDRIKVGELLEKYFGLVKEKIEEINPGIEREIEENKKDIFLVELRNQVRFLQTSVEIKAVENKMLRETVGYFQELFLTEKQNINPILIQTNSNSQAIQENTIEIVNKIKIKPENNEAIWKSIESIKQEILADKEIDSKFQSDVFGLFIELEKELVKGEVDKGLINKILEKSSKISSIGTFMVNLVKYLL